MDRQERVCFHKCVERGPGQRGDRQCLGSAYPSLGLSVSDIVIGYVYVIWQYDLGVHVRAESFSHLATIAISSLLQMPRHYYLMD